MQLVCVCVKLHFAGWLAFKATIGIGKGALMFPALSSSLQVSSHGEVQSLDQLRLILQDGVTSCRYARCADARRGAQLDAIAKTEPFERWVLVSEVSARAGVTLLTLGLPWSEATAWLERDMTALVSHFLRIAGSARCKIRLEVMSRNACRRFHHDHNKLRLLCTYAGPGTFWVAREHVNVEALCELGGDVELANRRIVHDPSKVRQAAAWDVLLLKGANFAESERIGAVHRSPPAETLGTPRFLLTIDNA
jgi:hypothetical protein